MPQIPQSNASLEDVISMPLDFNGLLSALCGDHFDVVDSYAEPNYPHYQSTTVVSTCDIMDQVKKMENFMTSFKEEVFRRLSALENSKAQTPSTPSNIAIPRKQPLVDINSTQSSPAASSPSNQVQLGIELAKTLHSEHEMASSIVTGRKVNSQVRPQLDPTKLALIDDLVRR
jgi:hypothetical protein